MIPDGSRVLVDSVVLIYFLERNPRYFLAARELLRRVESGALTAVVSTLCLAEVLTGEYRRSAADAQALRRAIVGMPNLDVLPVTQSIAAESARIRAEHRLHTRDAVHVATALAGGAGWLVANDRALRRVDVEGVRVWLLDDAHAPAPPG